MFPKIEKIAEHLHNADDFIRSRRYSDALHEAEQILKLDPGNYQGRTLLERVQSLQRNERETPKIPTILTKEGIYKHLRLADAYLLDGNLDRALHEVELILGTDPNNYHARSVLDRIHAAQKKGLASSQQREQATSAAMDARLQTISQHLIDADKLIKVKQYKSALEQVAKVFALDSTNHFAKAFSERIEMLMEAEPPAPPAPASPPAATPTPPPPPAPSVPTPPPPPAQVPLEPEGRIKMYHEILNEMWFDGVLSEKEAAELKRVRGLFNISEEQHRVLEREVKANAYVDALRIVLHDGVISDNEARVLELMRKRYGITMEEHAEAEAKIRDARRTKPSLGTILIVDDEKTILLTYAAILGRHGYKVISAESVEEAMAILEKTTPQLILSDIMFPSSIEGGFEFYNHVRNNKRFNGVPFLLMSGISDEYVMRAGMRLGIDGFLLKPFNNELLLATIEGQLAH